MRPRKSKWRTECNVASKADYTNTFKEGDYDRKRGLCIPNLDTSINGHPSWDEKA